jgi:hypothetical protein
LKGTTALRNFTNYWDEVEGLADSGGLDPVEAAYAIIVAATHENEISRRHAIWIVYAVLRHAADNIDLTGFIDHAGVFAGPPTIFDLAEHQHIKAEIIVDNKQTRNNKANRKALRSIAKGKRA